MMSHSYPKMLFVLVPVVPLLQFSAKDHVAEFVPACSGSSLKSVGSWDQAPAWVFIVFLGLFLVSSMLGILGILPAGGGSGGIEGEQREGEVCIRSGRSR